jgi:hypothetical protein
LGGIPQVIEESGWTAEESVQFDNSLIDNFAHFARHSTDKVVLSIAKVRSAGELIGVAPLMHLIKYRGTRLLEPKSRRWLDPLFGFFSRKTTCLVDTSLMGFWHRAPFIARNRENELSVRDAVIAHLKRRAEIDTIIISEPASDPTWTRSHGFTPFLQLPLVRVDVEGCRSFDDYLQRTSKKRRHHVRQERKLFEDRGATIQVLPPPIEPALARTLHRLLTNSANRNASLEVPFSELMNSEEAFCTQRQWVIIARLDGAIIGFFSFIPCGEVIHQCHGGLDYSGSLKVKAYPNLMHAAIEYAIQEGFRQVTFGPLNNEAKRRAGDLAPMMSAFWCRDAVSGFLMRKVLMPRLQVYTGPVGEDVSG